MLHPKVVVPALVLCGLAAIGAAVAERSRSGRPERGPRRDSEDLG